jgi:hypothetical protein
MFLHKLTKHEDFKDLTGLIVLLLLAALTAYGMILYFELIDYIHTSYLQQCELTGYITDCQKLKYTERGLF